MRKLTDSEVATILHGLRLVQEQAGFSDGDCHKGNCDHFYDAAMPSMETIDELCEAINVDCWLFKDSEIERWKPVRTAASKAAQEILTARGESVSIAEINDAYNCVMRGNGAPVPVSKPVSESGHEDDQSWPFCDACGSWHHPKNPTCVLLKGKMLNVVMFGQRPLSFEWVNPIVEAFRLSIWEVEELNAGRMIVRDTTTFTL